MKVTEKDIRTAQKITTVLNDEKCTVSETKKVFGFLLALIEIETTVQCTEERIQELFADCM